MGVDTGFDVSKSFYELGFGEPRWRPSPIQARMVAAGLHGRKSGRGYYEYGTHPPEPYRPEDPEPPTRSAPGDGEGLVVIGGKGVLADELRAAAASAGYEVGEPHDAQRELPALIVECGARDELKKTPRGGPHVLLCDGGSLAALDPGGPSVGFHVLPPFGEARLVELTRSESSSPRQPRARSASSRRWASTRSGWATRRAWCWAGSCAA